MTKTEVERLPMKQSVLKKLFAYSGNLCAMPDCNNALVSKKGTMIGKIAHIQSNFTSVWVPQANDGVDVTIVVIEENICWDMCAIRILDMVALLVVLGNHFSRIDVHNTVILQPTPPSELKTPAKLRKLDATQSYLGNFG